MAKKAEIKADENDNAKIVAVAMEILKDRAQALNPPKLNITKIAKGSSISRAWIYKNFGSSTEEIVLAAIDVIAPMLIAPRNPTDQWQKVKGREWFQAFAESLNISLEQVEIYPYLFRFYIVHRVQNSTISKRLAYHEDRFSSFILQQQISSQNEAKNGESIKLLAEHLAAVRLGLIFKWLSHPDLTTEKKRAELTMTLQMTLSMLG